MSSKPISRSWWPAVVSALILLPAASLLAQDTPTVFDQVDTKDGSRIMGKIVDMSAGALKISTAFDGDVTIPWKDVVGVKTGEPVRFRLEDGTEIVGMAEPGKEGTLDVKAKDITQTSTVSLEKITDINPKDTVFKGNLSLGLAINRGNTNTRAFNTLAEFEARHARHRLQLRGAYSYADDEESGVTAQYGMGNVNYAFFITKRLYAFANALFEHDGIQDLNLRTALSAGPGYQLIDKGDFTASWLQGMQLYVEAGIAYYNEDYGRSPDTSTVAARWALKFDWPFIPGKVAFFHYDEGYPSLERGSDIYITTQTGLRFTIWQGFVATAQVNWRWDNTPSPGSERIDVLYLLTLGYSFLF